jgi:hypothetical protein
LLSGDLNIPDGAQEFAHGNGSGAIAQGIDMLPKYVMKPLLVLDFLTCLQKTKK